MTILGVVDRAGLMQMEGLTRIYRCRYFRGSSLHFFYRLITGYLTGAKNALCGFLLHIVGRILFLLFEPRLFSPCYYLKLKQKYRCRRNISSLYPATTRTAFYPSDLRALWTLLADGRLSMPWISLRVFCAESRWVLLFQCLLRKLFFSSDEGNRGLPVRG